MFSSTPIILVAYLAAIQLLHVPVFGEVESSLDGSSHQVVAQTSPCDTVRCGYGASCEVVNGRASCVCPSVCPYIESPFCASDGETYGNECLMKVRACNEKKPLPVKVHSGLCTSFDRKPTANNDPCATLKCGFGASCVNENGKGICKCPSICPQIYAPVCASDGKTYGNECFMRVQACNDRRPLPVVVHQGACTTSGDQKGSATNPAPVSSCKGRNNHQQNHHLSATD